VQEHSKHPESLVKSKRRYEKYFAAWGLIRCTPKAFETVHRFSKLTLIELLRQDRGRARYNVPFRRLLKHFSRWQLIIMVAHLYQDDYHTLKNYPHATWDDCRQAEIALGTWRLPKPRTPFTKIIFLSVDGVVNSAVKRRIAAAADPPCQDPLSPILVKRIWRLARSTKSKIVVTRAWDGREYSLKRLRRVFQRHGFLTPRATMVGVLYDRADVQLWLSRHPTVEKFAVIDIREAEYAKCLYLPPHLQHHFVQTNFIVGLQEHQVNHATKLLT
jgi:hypothetical protein